MRFFIIFIFFSLSLLQASLLDIVNFNRSGSQDRLQGQTVNWSVTISTSNAGVSLQNFEMQLLTSTDAIVPNNQYDLRVKNSNGEQIFNDGATKPTLFFSDNSSQTFQVEVDLKDAVFDAAGFQLTGTDGAFKLRLKGAVVSGNSLNQVFTSVSNDQINSKGISGLKVSVEKSYNLLVPEEAAVLLRVSANVEDNLLIKSLSLFKNAEYTGDKDDVVESISIVRHDYLTAANGLNMTPSSVALNKQDLLNVLNREDIFTLSSTALAQSQVFLTPLNFKLNTASNENVFYVLYQLNDAPSTNQQYQANLRSITFQLGSEEIVISANMNDVLHPLDQIFLTSQQSFDIVQLGIDNEVLPGFDFVVDGFENVLISGGNKGVPVLAFDVVARQSPMKINSFKLKLDDTFKFAGDSDSREFNKITAVSLYLDKGSKGQLDPLDELVLTLNTGQSSNSFLFELPDFEEPTGLNSIIDPLNNDDFSKSYLFAVDFGSVLSQGTNDFDISLEEIEASIITSISEQQTPLAIGLGLIVNDVNPRYFNENPTFFTRNLQETSIAFVSLNSFLVQSLLQGMQEVNVFDIEFLNEKEDLDNISMLFRGPASQGVFSSAEGISSLVVYRLDASGSEQEIIGQAFSGVNVADTLNVEGLFFPRSTQTQKSNVRVKANLSPDAKTPLKIQFQGFEGTSFSGVLPQPLTPHEFTILPLNIPYTVSLSNANNINLPGSAGEAILSLTVQNSRNDMDFQFSVSPRVYFEKIAGVDISSSFSFFPLENSTLLVPRLSSKNFDFVVRYLEGSRFFDGLAFLDLNFNILLTNPNDASLQGKKIEMKRKQTSQGMVGNVIFQAGQGTFILDKQDESDEGRYASFIEKIHYSDLYNESIVFTQDDLYFSREAVRIGGFLRIKMFENVDLDISSIVCRFEGNDLPKVSEGQTDTFSFFVNQDELYIDIYNLPDTQGLEKEIVLSASDEFNGDFQSSSIKFMSHTAMAANRFFIHPNPYSSGLNSSLKIGLNLTEPADLEFFLFNHNGRKIWQSKVLSSQTKGGYNLFTNDNLSTLSQLKNALKPGMYLSKVLIRSLSGKEIYQETKMVVY